MPNHRDRVGCPRCRPRAQVAEISILLSDGPSTVSAMPPLPRVTGRGLVRALSRLGWVVVAQKGSHAHLKHPARGGRVTVPLHAGETIGPGLLRSILNQAGLTADDLRAVL